MKSVVSPPDRRALGLRIARLPQPSASGFRPDVEGLRGIAVLLVVLYHAGVPWMQGGFIGVDVFFVLSGYLITGLLAKEIESTGTLDLRGFYARRIRRLLPASLLMLLVVAGLGMLVFSPLEQERIARTALATSTYLSNFWFLNNAADYFAADSDTNPLLHTWSLAVEEQFYIIWPILILLALRGRSRRVLVGAIGGVTIASFVAAVMVMRTSQPWAFFGSPLRAWEFATGGAAALLPAARLLARRRWSLAMGWAGTMGVLAAAAAYTEETVFPGVTALLPVLGTTIALVGGVGAPGAGIGRILGAAPLQWLGKHSYGWYLWHWPALVFAAALVPGLTLPGALAAAAVSLGIAAATFRLIESPIRFHPALKSRAGLSLGLGLLLTAGGVAASQVWLRVAWRILEWPEQQAYMAVYADHPATDDNECSATFSETTARACVYGDTSGTGSLVLFGDSHASHWFPALDSVARARGLRLVTLTRSSCPAADVTVYHSTLHRDNVECDAWRRDAMSQIVALHPVGVVVGSSMVFVEGVPGESAAERLSLDQWRDGYRRTLRFFDRAGLPTWVMRDNPRSDFDVLTCLSRLPMPLQRWMDTEDCGLTRDENLPEWVFAAEREAAAGLTNVRVVDMTDQFCDGSRCDAVRNGKVVYRDGDHITASYSATLAPVLAERMRLRVPAAYSMRR